MNSQVVVESFSENMSRVLEGRRGLILLLLLSFCIKTIILANTSVITPDGPLYVNQAQMILEGNLGGAMALHGNMFFYPLLMAGLHFLIPDLILNGQLISLFASVFTLIPLYLLTRNIWGGKVAFWAGVAFIVMPGLNLYSTKVMRDPGFLFAFAWAIYFAWKAMTDLKLRHFMAVWAFSLLAMLFRIEGFLFPPVFLAAIVSAALWSRDERRALLKGAGFFLLPCLLVISCLYLVYGDHLLSFNRFDRVVNHFKDYVGAGLFDYLPQVKGQLKNLEAVLPGGATDNDFGEFTSKNIRFFYFVGLVLTTSKVMYIPIFLLFVWGISLDKSFTRGHLLLGMTFVIYFLMAFVFLLHRNFLEDRFVYVPVMVMLPWAGISLNRLFDRARSYPAPLICLFASLFLIVPIYEQFRGLGKQEVSVRQAGEWVKKQEDLDTMKIAANSRRIPLYAGRGLDYVAISVGGPRGFLDMEREALRVGAELLAVETRAGGGDTLPEFEHFDIVAKFTDKRNAGLIYRKKS